MDSDIRTAHGEPRTARTPSREQLSSSFFLDFLCGSQYLFDYCTYVVTGFCGVVVLHTPPGERPPAILRDVVAPCVLYQTVRETR